MHRKWKSLDAVGACITGTITFLLCWIYAIATYGLLTGAVLGGLASLAIAFFAGMLWPSIALLALAEAIILVFAR